MSISIEVKSNDDAIAAKRRRIAESIIAELGNQIPDLNLLCFFVDDLVEWTQNFHQMIYLHGNTCSTEVGLVMTFAHELQHFVQYGRQREIWLANTAIMMNFPRRVLKLAGVKIFHIPIELEARITSRRITTKLCGEGMASAYIDTRIRE